MATTWEPYELPGVPPGAGWEYDDEDTAYDSLIDDETGHTMYYDSEGTAQVWTTQNKS